MPSKAGHRLKSTLKLAVVFISLTSKAFRLPEFVVQYGIKVLDVEAQHGTKHGASHWSRQRMDKLKSAVRSSSIN